MMKQIATCLLVVLLTTGVLVSGIPVFISYASTEGGGGGASDEGTESSDEGSPSEPEPEAEPEPETTPTEPEPEPETPPVTEPEPKGELPPSTVTEEPPAAAVEEALPLCDGSPQDCITNNGDICLKGQGGHECECEDDMSDCPNHPSLQQPPVTEPREPLPYCDTIKLSGQDVACHDRRDVDELTGLYPCNDGTQQADWKNCADASETPVLQGDECEPKDTNCDGKVIIPEPTPCLLDPSDPSCPEPVDGVCPEGFNMNEDGNCFPEHDRCPEGFHSHEDDETGRCIPDSTPCDDGFIRDPDFPTCSLKERLCIGHPNIDECKEDNGNGDDNNNGHSDHDITIVINKIINEIHTGKHHDAFPEVDIIGLSTKQNGDSMVCLMDIDDDDIQCQNFGMPSDRVNGDFWRIIETNHNKDYDNGNTGSNDVDDAIDAIKSQDFVELDNLSNHDFGVDLAWIAINPQGDGFTCLTEDDRGRGPSLCEPFKVSAADVSGQITEGVEFS